MAPPGAVLEVAGFACKMACFRFRVADGFDRLVHGQPHPLLVRLAAGAFRALSDEGRFLVLFALLAGVAGLDVRHNEMHLVWCGAVGLLLASLVVRPFFALRDVTVEIEHPSRVVVGETIRVTVLLTNHGKRTQRALRAEGAEPDGAAALPLRCASLSVVLAKWASDEDVNADLAAISSLDGFEEDAAETLRLWAWAARGATGRGGAHVGRCASALLSLLTEKKAFTEAADAFGLLLGPGTSALLRTGDGK